MSDFEIEVVGTRSRQAPRRASRFLAALRWLFRPRVKLWAVLAGLGGMLIYGTPHLLVEYRCVKSGGSCQFYTECRYYGVQGWRYGEPHQGQCGLVRLIEVDWDKVDQDQFTVE